ncbi:hypothetical protein FF2_015803 [Malus domestica]
MENLISLVNKIQRACTALGDYGEGSAFVVAVVAIAVGDRPNGVSYKPLETKSDAATVFSVLNALGITTFAFRGHNPVLEVQGTMPSSSKRPSRLPMWEGVIPFLNIQNIPSSGGC